MTNPIKPRRSYVAGSVPQVSGANAIQDSELVINWTDGKLYSNNNGSLITLSLGGSGGSYTLPTASGSTLGGIKIGSGLSIDGNGVVTATDAGLRAYFLPTAPTNLAGTAGNGQVSLTWTASSAISQIPVTDYVIQYSSDSGSTWTTWSHSASTTASATVTGLTNGTSYVFRVAGVNGVGTGSYSTSSSAVAPGTDPFFSSVSLLLHADGSNGSTTFTDSSGTPKTATANGNAAISSTAKFGSGSASFDGSGDYVAVGGGAGQLGSGDFTVEFWARPTSLSTYTVLTGTFATANSGQWQLLMNGSGSLDWFGLNSFAGIGGSLPTGSWSHVAITRSGSTLAMYINGTRTGTATNSENYSSSGDLWIGRAPENESARWFNGLIDDYRVTVGAARYSGSTITVPTAAFPNS